MGGSEGDEGRGEEKGSLDVGLRQDCEGLHAYDANKHVRSRWIGSLRRHWESRSAIYGRHLLLVVHEEYGLVPAEEWRVALIGENTGKNKEKEIYICFFLLDWVVVWWRASGQGSADEEKRGLGEREREREACRHTCMHAFPCEKSLVSGIVSPLSPAVHFRILSGQEWIEMGELSVSLGDGRAAVLALYKLWYSAIGLPKW